MTQRIKPIEDSKKTIAAMVQERIREAIMNGILPAGSRLDQNGLAADLNVSLVPVREALKKLEAEGFVQIIPRRGAFVTETSLKDMENLYYARAILEGQTAYQAAEHISAEQLDELGRLIGQMTNALHQHDYAGFLTLNHRFHFIIYDAAGNTYLSNMILGLWDLAERYRYRFVFLKDQADTIQREHQAILDACRDHDPKRLRDTIVYHMNRTLDGVQKYILSEQSNHNENA